MPLRSHAALPFALPTPTPPSEAGALRRVWPAEAGRVEAHLQRLSAQDRQFRFGRTVSDAEIAAYCARIDWMRETVFGLMIAGDLKGCAMLTPLDWRWPLTASAALSVDGEHQQAGHGRRMLARLLIAARNRLYQKIYVRCLHGNDGMAALTQAFGGRTDTFRDETESLFEPGWPTPASMALEAAGENEAMILAWFRGPARQTG